MKVKHLQVHKWCPACGKPVHFSCIMLFGAIDDPNVVDLQICQCMLITTFTASGLVGSPARVPAAFQKAFKEGELEL